MKKRYIVAAVIILLTVPSVVTNRNILVVAQDIALLWALYLIGKVSKDGPLVGGEKVQVIITEVFSPIIAGAFYYFCWKNQFPIKAKQANKYAWIIFAIDLLLVFVPLIIYLVWLKGQYNAAIAH